VVRGGGCAPVTVGQFLSQLRVSIFCPWTPLGSSVPQTPWFVPLSKLLATPLSVDFTEIFLPKNRGGVLYLYLPLYFRLSPRLCNCPKSIWTETKFGAYYPLYLSSCADFCDNCNILLIKYDTKCERYRAAHYCSLWTLCLPLTLCESPVTYRQFHSTLKTIYCFVQSTGVI